MKLYVLSCGQTYVEKAFLWHFGSSEDTGKEYTPESFLIANNQYYIDHPEAKILFDTGWNLKDLSYEGFPLRRGPEGLYVKQEPDENPVE